MRNNNQFTNVFIKPNQHLMKSIEDTLLKRTSVRRYEREDIAPEKLDFIYRAIENTPTSYNGQQFSVIAIDDQKIKEESYT